MAEQPKTALDVLRELIVHLPQVIGIIEQKDTTLAKDLTKHLEDGRQVLKGEARKDVVPGTSP